MPVNFPLTHLKNNRTMKTNLTEIITVSSGLSDCRLLFPQAQKTSGTLGAWSATTPIDGIQLPAPDPKVRVN